MNQEFVKKNVENLIDSHEAVYIESGGNSLEITTVREGVTKKHERNNLREDPELLIPKTIFKALADDGRSLFRSDEPCACSGKYSRSEGRWRAVYHPRENGYLIVISEDLTK